MRATLIGMGVGKANISYDPERPSHHSITKQGKRSHVIVMVV
ncbi:hypothetical protein KDA_75180 [Dictyobacter alpinus]|uniref:Uncharacterized protein n=1 Tax=Dictyobacter alpinus TaxID=2014873 RepID=A0A402BL12_9CHLR|nr:hypothetical protein [Dictyobacter alpinus]GCE32034.1 hypothetical protein KDA_75180 [Dictyobacter alpinus]